MDPQSTLPGHIARRESLADQPSDFVFSDAGAGVHPDASDPVAVTLRLKSGFATIGIDHLLQQKLGVDWVKAQLIHATDEDMEIAADEISPEIW